MSGDRASHLPTLLSLLSMPVLSMHQLVVGFALATATLVGRPALAAAQTVGDSAAVVRVVEQFHRALATGDSAAVLASLAPDVVILESGGAETLADYRAHHLPADIQFARAVPSVRGAATVAIVGDAAWVSSTSTTQGTFKDRAINSVGAELVVLSKSNGQWRIRAVHWSSRSKR